MSSNIDWQTIQVSLPGLTTPIYARYEYTSGEVATDYNDYLKIIAAVYNTPNDPTSATPSSLSNSDVTKVANALQGLYDLAQTETIDANGKAWYLNTEMASNLDLLAKSFISVGFAVPGVAGVGDQLEALNAWKDLSALSSVITNILKTGLDTFNTNRSLQAMIELNYIGTANDLVESQLDQLETALTLTKGSLNVLSGIQDIHNQMNVLDKLSIDFNYLQNYGNGKNYVNAYNIAASNYFGKQISPILGFSLVKSFVYDSVLIPAYLSHNGGGFTIIVNPHYELLTIILGDDANAYVNQMISLRNSLVLQIAQYNTTLTADQKSGAGNIYSALTKVLADINQHFVDSNGNPITATSTASDKGNAISNWILDKYNDPNAGSDQGQIQSSITSAITAAQSLNDTQKQNVQNYLFVFEQYYKSASAILQSITQLIERIAQGIRS